MIIYTDGACSQNPNGVGAWAYVVMDELNKKAMKKKVGRELVTTSNRMEVMAILEALRDHPEAMIILSDSKYAVNCINGTWKAKANLDLIIPAKQLLKKNNSLSWIKGHSGILGNELADEACGEEMKEAFFERNGIEFTGFQQDEVNGGYIFQ